MTQFTAQVQELGRVAIPKVVRDVEGIEHGDYVMVDVTKVQKKKK